MAELLTLKTCSNCFAKFKHGNDIQCRFNPPVVQPIIANTNKGPQVIGQFNAFPIVQPDWWCRQHKPGLAINMEEMKQSGELVA